MTDLMAKYPSTQLVFHVRRSLTPDLSAWATVTYNTTVVNVEDCMDISTGIFTVPIAGLYYFAWTGPNGEYISRHSTTYTYLELNGKKWEVSWATSDAGNLKSHLTVQLNKGDKLSLTTVFSPNFQSKQYERCVGYFLG